MRVPSSSVTTPETAALVVEVGMAVEVVASVKVWISEGVAEEKGGGLVVVVEVAVALVAGAAVRAAAITRTRVVMEVMPAMAAVALAVAVEEEEATIRG